MSMDLTGISNQNEYYTNHYFSTVFGENASESIQKWNAAAKQSKDIHTPWSDLRRIAGQYYPAHDRYVRSSVNMQTLLNIRDLAAAYLQALGYPQPSPAKVMVEENLEVPVFLEMKKQSGAPFLWVILMAPKEKGAGIMESYAFSASDVAEDAFGTLHKGVLGEVPGEELATKVLFAQSEPPRFLLLIGIDQIALIDRNKWNEKRYLQFELDEIFSRLENSTLQAMAVLLHKDSLCPDDGKILLDELDEQSQRNASGVSQDLKYALRESIELLGNEVLYDMRTRQGRNLEENPVDAGQLTLECLRYMYRMLFLLFIEARPELGYAPIRSQSYYSGYSLESLRDIADSIREDVDEVGDGYYLDETLSKLFDLIYNGYPKTEEELKEVAGEESIHDMFLIAPLKAHIFDPQYTEMISSAKLRNRCMLRIIELMSLTKADGKKNSRRGRISYANLGINQMGAVYEALLSYRGFIAKEDLYEVKRAGDKFNELDVGYFVPESELSKYAEEERVRYEDGENKGKLRMYRKGSFIYRLAGREREKSASYYTPEVLTKCLVKYALKELLKDKTADEILNLTVCEPAMGSAAFLNEAINQLAEAYISKKEQETGKIIGYEDRFNEIQKVKMYIADRNVYGIDLNPVAVELAEVSLWLNTIYEGGFVPWFGTQLVNGNSLIGARRQVYSEANLTTTSKGLHWYELAPDRVPIGNERKKRRGNAQIWHFLLGDPGMCNYTDKVIKSLEPENIKKMKNWNKAFTAPYTADELESLRQLSNVVDDLWDKQVKLREEGDSETVCNAYLERQDKVYSYAQKAEEDRRLIESGEKFDYLVVGAGLFGSVFADQARKAGKSAVVIDKRPHIGGNVYTDRRSGIDVHEYGAHIFHTSNQKVWQYVNQFADFNQYINSPVARYKNELYNLPFNMNTFARMWGLYTPEEVQAKIEEQRRDYIERKLRERREAGDPAAATTAAEATASAAAGLAPGAGASTGAAGSAGAGFVPQNLEEQAISLVGTDIYEKLIRGYTEKQWGRPAAELPAFIIRRLPLRFTYDNNYFNDRYQGIPIGGYTQIIEKMLAGVPVMTGVDYKTFAAKYEGKFRKVIYTGPIDEYFDYRLGRLQYRTVRFETEELDTPNFQGNAVVNYTDREVPWTRIIEHKWFEFGKDLEGADIPKTIISREYSTEWKPGMEPYYPVNDEKNSELYRQYRALADQEKNVIFGGRLGTYQYYNMDQVILQAWEAAEKELGTRIVLAKK